MVSPQGLIYYPRKIDGKIQYFLKKIHEQGDGSLIIKIKNEVYSVSRIVGSTFLKGERTFYRRKYDKTIYRKDTIINIDGDKKNNSITNLAWISQKNKKKRDDSINKRKLTILNMISHFKSKGITFNEISEIEAKKILQENTYFYKITSYRKNFIEKKYRKNFNTSVRRYVDLDFSMLSDLAIIDMRLRYLFLELSLDYEHAIKTKILNIIANDRSEDGYSIVEKFKKKHNNAYSITMNYFNSNKYSKEMYRKRKNKVAIWTLFEVISFGSLSLFIDFLWEEKGYASIKEAKDLTKYAKNIRNAAAHSNPLLINLFDKTMQKKNDQTVVSYANLVGINSEDLRDKKINDIFSLIYLHKLYCSKGINKARTIEIESLLERSERHKEWYVNIENLKKFHEIIKLSLDYLKK